MSVSLPQTLTPQEIREYTSDYAVNNYLIDGEEMSDTFLSLCMTLAVDSFNSIPPKGAFGVQNFHQKQFSYGEHSGTRTMVKRSF